MKRIFSAAMSAAMAICALSPVAASSGSLLFGDPNNDGKIDAKDASFVLEAYSKLSTGSEDVLTAEQSTAANVNRDDKVDAKDASAILAYYSYLSTGGTDSIECYLGYEETPVTTTTSDISTQTTTTEPIATTTAPSQDDPSNYDEDAILANMYAKGYIPVGTYSGSYTYSDSEYGYCFHFTGSNKNGGSGTSYNFTDPEEAYYVLSDLFED